MTVDGININTAVNNRNEMSSQYPRLYKGIIEGTGMLFEEIPSFRQTDLRQDAVFVLDMGDELFVWIGEDVTEEERKVIFNIHRYLQPLKASYPQNWMVVMTKQGLEPEDFKKSFGNWQYELLAKLRDNDDENKYDALNFNEIED